jgi:catechol 2,3-dioxygenase-like lactoylglutathione lyase family enzyme
MQVQFITSVAIIAPDPPASRKLYLNTLGLPLEQLDGDYFASEHIAGSKHFGVWPLSQAAQACYGTPDWPHDVPIPQASIEFEVANSDAVTDAAQELQTQGYALLHPPRTEPWGQTVAASSPQKASSSGFPPHCSLPSSRSGWTGRSVPIAGSRSVCCLGSVGSRCCSVVAPAGAVARSRALG